MKGFVVIIAIILPKLVISQFYGGYSQFEYVGGNNPFKITLITYTDTNFSNQFCEAEIKIAEDYGPPFFYTFVLPRQNGPNGNCDSLVGSGEYIELGIQRNVYSTEIPLLGLGSYTIQYSMPSYSSAIVNQLGGQNFVSRNEVYYPPIMDADATPYVRNDQPLIAEMGTTSYFDPMWEDADGDSIVFRLVPPEGVFGYVHIESFCDTIQIGRQSGIVEIQNPQTPGWFSFQVVCDQYRNGFQISSTNFIYSILVKEIATSSSSPHDLNKFGLDIFPNPATTELNFKVNSNVEIEQISIYDLQGSILLTVKSIRSIDISKLSQGIYVIEVISQKGERSFSRFIKINP
jgi:hypothetical protein